MTDESGFLDQGRKRSPLDHFRLEHGLDLVTAGRLWTLAKGDREKAGRLVYARTDDEVAEVLLGPMLGPLIGYDPRLTGPIPDGLTPFVSFVHSGVSVTPLLARKLERRMSRLRPVSWPHVRSLAAAMVDPDRPWAYSPEHRVLVDQRGTVVDGRHLVLAVLEVDRAITLDVWHNVSDGFARIESREYRRRSAGDMLSSPRLRRREGR